MTSLSGFFLYLHFYFNLNNYPLLIIYQYIPSIYGLWSIILEYITFSYYLPHFTILFIIVCHCQKKNETCELLKLIKNLKYF